MDFTGQWKTDTGFKVTLTSYDGHRTTGEVTDWLHTVYIPNNVVSFDTEGYPIDYPHLGKLMTRRRGEESW